MTAASSERPSFTPERLQRLLDMNQRHFWFAGRRMLVDRLLRLYRKGDRILDLGTGAGASAERLGHAGLNVTAVDFLPHGLARLRSAGAKVALVQSSAEALSLSANTFDAVLLLDVIEHLDDRAVLREVYRILRPGGTVFITVPAFAWLWSYRDDAAGHRRRYSHRALSEIIANTGFRVEHICYYQCLLFPLAIVARYAGRSNPAIRDSEDMPPAWINALFTVINKAEVAIGRFMKWPWGSSLAAVGIKT